MFCAINLWGFAEDGGAAVCHQQVYRCTQGGVGADARITVRAAALQSHGDVGDAARLALGEIGCGQHGGDQSYALGHREAGAAAVLDIESLQHAALFQATVRQPRLQLIGFATQAHRQHTGEIGVGGVTRQGALQHLHA